VRAARKELPALRDELRPDGRWRLEPLGELRRAGQAQQLRAVDIDHVERDRHTGGPARLGHQLVADEMRRHLIASAPRNRNQNAIISTTELGLTPGATRVTYSPVVPVCVAWSAPIFSSSLVATPLTIRVLR
jgi:hypothetical protein